MRRMFHAVGLAVILASSAASAVIAQQAAAPAAPAAPAAAAVDPARQAAAEALVAAMGAADQARATIEHLRQALIAHTQATEPAKVIGFAAYADRELAPGSPRMTSYLSEVSKLASNFYAARFTVEEMNAIAAFQKSEAGRKFQALTPELGGQIAERTMRFQADLIRAIQQGAAGPGMP